MSREEFLKSWGRLRFALSETPEYKNFRMEVIARSGKMCQKCYTKVGREVHHVIRVVDNPDLALDPNNAIYICYGCHKEEHAQKS